MDTVITSISGLTTDYLTDAASRKTGNGTFESIMQAAMDLVNETENLNTAAEYEEMKVMLGYAENTHDLGIALEKAEMAVQYTVAVKNKVLEAYKEIMNMQI